MPRLVHERVVVVVIQLDHARQAREMVVEQPGALFGLLHRNANQFFGHVSGTAADRIHMDFS